MIGVGHPIEDAKHIFKGTLGINHKAAIRASWFVRHHIQSDSPIHAAPFNCSCMNAYRRGVSQIVLRELPSLGASITSQRTSQATAHGPIGSEHRRLGAPRFADWRIESGSFHTATRNGGGNRRLLIQESNTSRDDAQRQACIPAASVLPSMKTAPDINVPTNRPAALAM